MAMSRLREAVREREEGAVDSIARRRSQLPFLANDQNGAPINFERKLTRDRGRGPDARSARAPRAAVPARARRRRARRDGHRRGPARRRHDAVAGRAGRSSRRSSARSRSKGANPDEVVALGAAAYAGILAGDSDDAQLLDVTPHDIGIKVGDSQFAVVLPRNSMLPVRARRLFATTRGESEVRVDRALPGRVDGRDQEPQARPGRARRSAAAARPGSVRVELVITVDVESILSVTARELKTGREASVHDPAVGRPVAARDRRDHHAPSRRRARRRVGKRRLEGGAVRVTTREQMVSQLDPDDEPDEVGMDARSIPPVLRVADAVGALIEGWGFKRNMGRMWAVLYLEDDPLSAAELGERLGLSTGAVSMLLTELQQWGAVKKAWVVGERREHYEAETNIWKMVSRVFRERELQLDQDRARGVRDRRQAELEPGHRRATDADREADRRSDRSSPRSARTCSRRCCTESRSTRCRSRRSASWRRNRRSC